MTTVSMRSGVPRHVLSSAVRHARRHSSVGPPQACIGQTMQNASRHDVGISTHAVSTPACARTRRRWPRRARKVELGEDVADVPGDRLLADHSRSAIARLVMPVATRRSTSISRAGQRGRRRRATARARAVAVRGGGRHGAELLEHLVRGFEFESAPSTSPSCAVGEPHQHAHLGEIVGRVQLLPREAGACRGPRSADPARLVHRHGTRRL